MERAQNRFCDVFKVPSKSHGAAGWQMNTHALRLTQSMGFEYASDGRALAGQGVPHYPVVNAEIIDCPQLPTTLPTFDELIGLNGVTEANVGDSLLAMTGPDGASLPSAVGFDCAPHVFTMHAELEGMRLLPALEALIVGWKTQGYDLVATENIASQLVRERLPYFVAERGEVPGRSGTLLMQGRSFLPALPIIAEAA
jgi:peptidoglycan/xylan/chitin deacetylase (PgdA/CDA1 family)